MKAPVAARAPSLDTLRAFAILAVMTYHFETFLPDSIYPIAQAGWIGVDLFFVLSGYLIGSQLLKPYLTGRLPSIKDFYIRRVFRILPAYLVVLGLYVAVPVWRESPRLGPLWKFLTFTSNFGFNNQFHAFSLSWSLCVEEHFYLLLPLLVVWRMRRPSFAKTVVLLCALSITGMGIRWYMLLHLDAGYWPQIYYPTYTRLDGLLAGVTLALIRSFRPVWWSAIARSGHMAMLAGIMLVGSVLWMFGNDRMGETSGPPAWGTVVGFPMLALGMGCLVASSVSENGLLSRIPVPGAKLLASLAFSLYLTHKEVAHIDQTYFASVTEPRGLAAISLYAVSSLVVAAILHLCVERPFMMMRDHLYGEPKQLVEKQMSSEPAL